MYAKESELYANRDTGWFGVDLDRVKPDIWGKNWLLLSGY